MSYKTNYIGCTVIGYRYGKAPEDNDGNYRASYNYRDEYHEPGISLARVLRAAPCQSLAALENAERCKKYYYRGVINGIGSDGEFCLDPATATESTYNEYRSFCATHHALSNDLNAAQEKDLLAYYPIDLDGYRLEIQRNIGLSMLCVELGEDAAFDKFIARNQPRRERIFAQFAKYYYKTKAGGQS